jgi:hypothetical protein
MISLRVVLILIPYQFHAANQQRLFCTLVSLILGLPFLDCLTKVYMIGHPCDFVVDAVAQSLYQVSLALEVGPYQFPLFFIQFFSFFLFIITFLYEWRKAVKQQHLVGPMASAPSVTAYEGPLEDVPAIAQTTCTRHPECYLGHQPGNEWPVTTSTVTDNEHQVVRQAWGEISLDPARLNASRPVGLLAIAVPPATANPTGLSSPLAGIVARIGGLTVLALVLDLVILIFVIKVLGEDSTAIILALKAHCMSGQLVWYWISSSPEIREATDAKLTNALRKILPETLLTFFIMPAALFP